MGTKWKVMGATHPHPPGSHACVLVCVEVWGEKCGRCGSYLPSSAWSPRAAVCCSFKEVELACSRKVEKRGRMAGGGTRSEGVRGGQREGGSVMACQGGEARLQPGGEGQRGGGTQSCRITPSGHACHTAEYILLLQMQYSVRDLMQTPSPPPPPPLRFLLVCSLG